MMGSRDRGQARENKSRGDDRRKRRAEIDEEMDRRRRSINCSV